MTDGRPLLVAGTVAALAAAAALSVLDSAWSWLALAVPPAYVLALVAGVMAPRLALFAPVVSRGDPARAEVALTFDDGPDAATTPRVLEALAAADARATFFVLGEKARRAPQVLRAISAAGHEIGIHGETHDRRLSLRPPKAIAAALERARDAVQAVTGIRPRLFRPPMGHVSPRTAVAARSLGLTLVLWSVRARDGRATTTADEVTGRVRAGLRPGAIVLMHDAAEHGDRLPMAPAALPAILETIRAGGLQCVTLSELLRP